MSQFKQVFYSQGEKGTEMSAHMYPLDKIITHTIIMSCILYSVLIKCGHILGAIEPS